MTTINASFRQRVIAREPLMGIFVKTSSYQLIEVLEHARLDFLIIDAEHAPFDRNTLDIMLLAVRAIGVPAIVRISEPTEAAILAPLDLGAAGIMVPHVQNAEQAAAIVGYARYSGRRGFSNSPRAGLYGTRSIAAHLAAAEGETTIVAMIEDPAAVDNIDAIVAVEGIDALFLGRVDLAVTLRRSDVQHPDVEAVVQRYNAAAKRSTKPFGVFASNAAAVAPLMRDGARFFVLGTDQGLLRNAVANLVTQARDAVNRES